MNLTYILWCPHLSFGGSEKHVLELVRAAQGRTDVEVWVDSEDIAWGESYLQSFACKVRIHAGIHKLGQTFIENSLQRLGGRRLAFHIVNSAIGFGCLPFIAKLPNTDYYISAFGDNVLPDGRKLSYIRSLDQAYRDGAKRIFTDSNYYRDQLVNDGVVAAHKISVITHPAATHLTWERTEPARKLLWASRISDEKRLEDLFGIAVAFPMLEFHMYGGVDKACCTRRGEAVLGALQVLPNVRIVGRYKKFDDIPVSNYDALLYTSERDGVPNVLLEAGSAGMPVVSTIVGGIEEVLNQGNSFSKPRATLTDYLVFISDLYANYGAGRQKGQLLRSEIANRSAQHPLGEVLNTVLGTSAPISAVDPAPRSRIESGHDPFFVQNLHVSSRLRGIHRNQVFASLCDGRTVLHIGCADAPITNIANNLHLALQGSARVLDGFDLDTKAIEMLRPHLRHGRLFSDFSDVKDSYEVLLVPEVIEHVDNVEQFLQTLDKVDFDEVIIAAPDVYSSMHKHFDYDSETENFVEIVHPDHNAWYTPYTLMNVLRKYTTWTIEGMFFLEPASIMIVATKRPRQ